MTGIPESLVRHMMLTEAHFEIAKQAEGHAKRLFDPVSNKRSQLGGFRTVCASSGFDDWIRFLEDQARKTTTVWESRNVGRLNQRIGELKSGDFWNSVVDGVQKELRESSGDRDFRVELTEALKLELARMYMDTIIGHLLDKGRRR